METDQDRPNLSHRCLAHVSARTWRCISGLNNAPVDSQYTSLQAPELQSVSYSSPWVKASGSCTYSCSTCRASQACPGCEALQRCSCRQTRVAARCKGSGHASEHFAARHGTARHVTQSRVVLRCQATRVHNTAQLEQRKVARSKHGKGLGCTKETGVQGDISAASSCTTAWFPSAACTSYLVRVQSRHGRRAAWLRCSLTLRRCAGPRGSRRRLRCAAGSGRWIRRA